MIEPDSTGVRNRFAGDPADSAGADSGEEPLADASSPVASSRQGDPVIRKLTVAFFAVVALFLLAIVSALAFGFLSPPRAPRTLAERDLNVHAAAVESGEADTETWATYIGTLIDAGQLSKAQSLLTKP